MANYKKRPFMDLAPKLENQDLVLNENGEVVLVNALQWEAQARSTCVLGSWVYDPNYGSEMTLLQGSRAVPSRSTVNSFAREALQPMISKGVITPEILINSLVYPGTIKVNVTVFDNTNDPVTFSF